MLFPVSRRAPAVVLSLEERATLQSWAKARSQPQRLVQRAQVVLLAAEGIENQEIAARLRISRPTVQLWRQRLLALGPAGWKRTPLVQAGSHGSPVPEWQPSWRPRCPKKRRTPRIGAPDPTPSRKDAG